MVNIIGECSKYLMILLITAYTYQCFTVFGHHDDYKRKRILRRQNKLMFTIQFLAFLVMYLRTNDIKVLGFYLAQVVLFSATILLYTMIYPKVSRLVVNNMCMLLCIGFIMITRLSFEKAIKQFIIVTGAMMISLVVPVIIRKVKQLSELKMVYAVVGVISLFVVILVGRVTGGAMLGFTIAGISVQPSEFVKIVFVFFAAASLKASLRFRNVVITTAIAAAHVLILVASTDLGAALIIFMVYMVMLYVATRQPLYMISGLAAGSAASVAGYYMFGHVRTRVTVWRDPFAAYDTGGYQVAQSLFAIGTGSWFGLGLYKGAPDTIPVASEDFVFSAISEELGLIFALCLILICLSCYIMFLNIAMQLHDMFYKLVALGLGTCYIFQVFLTIGGAVKFIPSTGVTLPLVSYGGSSVLSTLIMFAIIQGLYILREDEEKIIERKRAEQLQNEEREEIKRKSVQKASVKKQSGQKPAAKKAAGKPTQVRSAQGSTAGRRPQGGRTEEQRQKIRKAVRQTTGQEKESNK